MSLMEQFREITTKRLDEKAQEVYRVMQSEAFKHRATGTFYRNIHIERLSETRRFIGVNTRDVPYAYYTEYGNHANAPDGLIHPVKAAALRLQRGEQTIGYAKAVRPSKGTHIVSNTRSKFR